MAYISRMIADGETLIGVSRLHWIYLVQGLFWLIGLMAIGFILDALIGMALGALVPGVSLGFLGESTFLELFFIGAGIYLFAVYFIKVATTEFALTSARVIYKVGWIFVDVRELNLDEVRGSHINLGALGRFLGYGMVSLDARFVGDLVTGAINKPYRFTKAMNEAQANIDSNISLVIDNVKGEKLHVRQPGQGGQISPGHTPASQAEPPAKAKAEQFEDQPILSPEQIEKALQGETITVPLKDKNPPAPPPTRQATEEAPFDPDNRPLPEAHPVAEGSYEEQKLKEDLNREWSESAEEEDPYSYRSSRQLH